MAAEKVTHLNGRDVTEPPRKRPRLQFHLSTAIVLTFVAGTLMWANLRADEKFFPEFFMGPPQPGGVKYEIFDSLPKEHPEKFVTIRWRYFGWPSIALTEGRDVRADNHQPLDFPAGSSLRTSGLLCDIAVAIAIFIFVGYVCERLLHRKPI